MRNPLSTEAFAEWLETMPPDQEYTYTSPTRCAICQYFDYIGLQYYVVSPFHWHDREGLHPLPSGWNEIAVSPSREDTFGQALARAKAALKGQEQ